MKMKDNTVKLFDELLNEMDKLESPEEKRKLLGWVATVWNVGLPQLAAYTNVIAEHRPKARSAIQGQLTALKDNLLK